MGDLGSVDLRPWSKVFPQPQPQPQPQTQVDIGELLRTTGFAAGPGVLRVFGIVPGLVPLILLAMSVWMLVAMVIAVRQALDFTSTGRTLMVCAAGWVIMLVLTG